MKPDQRAIFHLSFPVSSLDTSIAFYQACLGASVGRRNADWADVVLFGHQLTLHEQPGQVLARDARGVRHFGAIMDWEHWEAIRARILAHRPVLETDIRHSLAGETGEHVKLIIEDPDGNIIELKAYRHIESVAAALADA